jgi:hypothetical protein
MPFPLFRDRTLWRAGLASLLLAGFLVACGGSEVVQDQDDDLPTQETARSALEQSMNAFNTACLIPERAKQQGFPVTVLAPSRRERRTRYRELNALAASGVLVADTTSDRNIERLTFRVADEWESALRSLADARRGTQKALCYAEPRVTRIDTIKALRGRTTRKLAEVIFRYRYTEAAAWARHQGVQREFPEVRGFLQARTSEQQMSQTLVATDAGWVDARLRGLQFSRR